MYSLVLMMALSGGAETPAWHGGHGCCGCNGGGCYGDCGGRRHGCHGGGCWGGCNGGGCHGGCYGGGCYGCNGCGGGRHHRHGGGCCGCCGAVVYSCCGCYGGGGHAYPPPPAPPGGGAPSAPPGEKLKVPPKPTTWLNSPAPARILVSLPAEAKLSVDGVVTTSKDATRVFVSPALEQGKEFSYTLTAELVQDGRTVTTTEQVKVRAGQDTRVSFQFPAVSVAQR